MSPSPSGSLWSPLLKNQSNPSCCLSKFLYIFPHCYTLCKPRNKPNILKILKYFQFLSSFKLKSKYRLAKKQNPVIDLGVFAKLPSTKFGLLFPGFQGRNLPFLCSQSPQNLGEFFTPMQLENMVSFVSRTGRTLQRYDKDCRLVVGCIPYRYRKIEKTSSIDGTFSQELEVLVISSQNGKGMLFPKGGWELDETMEAAAERETEEEAGVIGIVERKLGKWQYKSRSQDTLREGYMFPLLVKTQLEWWPEKNIRQRRWMTADEAKNVCPHEWMKEALDVLVCRHMHLQQKEEQNETSSLQCSIV